MGLGNPPGLPKIQSTIVEVKTPRIEVFFIPLKSSWSLDVQNGLAWAIWTSTTQVMVERKSGSQTKSRELTRFQCVQVKCNTLLKSSQGELRLWFRPCPNSSSGWEVTNAQSPESPNRDNFGTPLWESWEKESFGCKCSRKLQRILYGGRWWLPPNPGRGESSEFKVARGLSQH